MNWRCEGEIPSESMILKRLSSPSIFGGSGEMILDTYAKRVMRGHKMWFQESAGK